MPVGLQLMNNALIPLAKSVLQPLGLTGSTSATEFGSGTKLIISYKEMHDIMKVVKSLE